MVRTTVYLSEESKRTLAKIAEKEGVKEAELIREGVERLLAERQRPRPTIPLFSSGLDGIARRLGDDRGGRGE